MIEWPLTSATVDPSDLRDGKTFVNGAGFAILLNLCYGSSVRPPKYLNVAHLGGNGPVVKAEQK